MLEPVNTVLKAVKRLALLRGDTMLEVLLHVGSRYETPALNGISHFLEHMLFRGSERFVSSYALNHAIESVGGTLYAPRWISFGAPVVRKVRGRMADPAEQAAPQPLAKQEVAADDPAGAPIHGNEPGRPPFLDRARGGL